MNDAVNANLLIVRVNYPQFSGGFGPLEEKSIWDQKEKVVMLAARK